MVSPGHGPIVSATLQGVIFADGQFVGVDEHGACDQFVKKISPLRRLAYWQKLGHGTKWKFLPKLLLRYRHAPLPERIPLGTSAEE